jgi:hypothetical protein
MDNKNVTYIYHDATIPNAAVKKLKDLNKRVSRINRGLTALTLVSAVYFTVMNLRCEMQREQMDKMSNDIEELKKAKGE